MTLSGFLIGGAIPAACHPFGTMKRMMSGRFLTRGIKGTSTEMALSVLAFNMIRSINMRTSPS
ncbi:MAG: hypothetical protein J0H79_05380 [Alphaproteobacteria bacterium]|nr:hypothetical protein [Alphaproteobacteria bacterium]